MDSVVFVFDGSFDGLLCAVFASYAQKVIPVDLVTQNRVQLGFEQKFVEILTDQSNARRVEVGFRKAAGNPAATTAWTAFLSGEPDAPLRVFRYLRAGFTLKHSLSHSLTHPDVLPVNQMERNIGREAQHMRGFTRFSAMENGVYYARITPKNNLLPILMPHFSDRFSVQPFLVFDPGHRLAGVYDRKEWYLVETADITLPALSPEEPHYRSLWKKFYHTIAIEERRNPTLRRTMCPKRFWANMYEMQGE
jgi:probable DNA metabolism protein